MKKPTEFIQLPCGCGARLPIVCPADSIGKAITCPWSSMPFVVGGGEHFGANEWDAFQFCGGLYDVIRELKLKLSRRKRRLLACGVARAVLGRSEYGFRLAIDCGEALADEQRPPLLLELARRELNPERSAGTVPPEYGIALRCIDPLEERAWVLAKPTGVSDDVMLAVFRELVPNPFVPLTWNSEWFTSTVRDLAAHIYATHEFGTMPILADALQDAGCDNDHILNHCRADKLHARGCWVLDAILGKT